MSDDLTPAQIKRFRHIDNLLAQMSDKNADNIKLELEEMQDAELVELYLDLDNIELEDENDLDEENEDTIPEEPTTIYVEE